MGRDINHSNTNIVHISSQQHHPSFRVHWAQHHLFGRQSLQLRSHAFGWYHRREVAHQEFVLVLRCKNQHLANSGCASQSGTPAKSMRNPQRLIVQTTFTSGSTHPSIPTQLKVSLSLGTRRFSRKVKTPLRPNVKGDRAGFHFF